MNLYELAVSQAQGLAKAGLNSRRFKKMAVPKRKVSPHRRGIRRSHDALKAVNVQEDQHTGEFKMRHHIDLKSGMYRGKQVIEPKGDY